MAWTSQVSGGAIGPVTETEIANAVACFGLAARGPGTVVARGAMGEIRRVPTDRGDVALKELFGWNSGASAPVEAASSDAARVAGVVVPRMLPSADGGWLGHTANGRWRASLWIEGEALTRGEHLIDVGDVLRRLRACANPHPGPVDSWYSTIPEKPRLDALTKDDARLLTWVNQAIALEASMGPAPPEGFALCHGDFAPSNLLRLPSGGLAVLDLEDVGPMAIDHEVGTVVLGWTRSLDDVRELRAGYGSGVTLTLSSFGTALGTSINFLVAQAQAARDSDVGSSDHAFGLAAVERVLQRRWDEGHLLHIASVWNGA